MAPKASRQKGKGVASDGDGAQSNLPKGSWEGSWVKEKRIELLHQGRVLPPADLVGCRPAYGKRVPTPQPGEAVVFYDHFPRGFALPTSGFLRQFLDHFHLQLYHIGGNAIVGDVPNGYTSDIVLNQQARVAHQGGMADCLPGGHLLEAHGGY
jgi:hypothetical protein